MILDTGLKLPKDKGVIRYGDILKSSLTHNVVVLHHEEKNLPIVKVVGEDVWFLLEDFLNSWNTRLEIDGNINLYIT